MFQEDHVTWEQLIGTRIRVLRQRDGLTQDLLAQRVRQLVGLDWTRATISAIETKGRGLNAKELVAVIAAFDLHSPDQLLPADEDPQWIRLSDDSAASPDYIRSALSWNPNQDLSGTRTPATADLLAELGALREARQVTEALLGRTLDREEHRSVAESLKGEAERKAARALGVHPNDVAAHAIRLWGRSLTQEREQRLTTDDLKNPKAVGIRRGHITRQLLAELTQSISEARQ